MSVTQVCKQAREASSVTRELHASAKDRVLLLLAEALADNADRLKAANSVDIDAARGDGVSGTLIDRRTLTDKGQTPPAQAPRTVAGLPDPVGQVVSGSVRPNGLLIEQVREPLGVV